MPNVGTYPTELYIKRIGVGSMMNMSEQERNRKQNNDSEHCHVPLVGAPQKMRTHIDRKSQTIDNKGKSLGSF